MGPPEPDEYEMLHAAPTSHHELDYANVLVRGLAFEPPMNL